MPDAARFGDSIQGTTAGEHSGHASPHPPSAITGEISGGCAENVFIEGQPAATVDSVTTEHDSCCGTNYGKIGGGSSKVFIKGKPIARVGDPVITHSGSGAVSSGSGKVHVNA